LTLGFSTEKVDEPSIRAPLGTTAYFCKVVVLKLRHTLLQAVDSDFILPSLNPPRVSADIWKLQILCG